MKWFVAIASFVFMQAYTQYAMWDEPCGVAISRAEKMLFIPFMASLLWLLAATLLMVMFAIVCDFQSEKEKSCG